MAAMPITTVHGELQLVIAGSSPITLGTIRIPIEVAPLVDSYGNLMLRTSTPASEVREFVEQVFNGPTHSEEGTG